MKNFRGLSVPEVLDQLEEVQGKSVEVRGRLIVTSDNAAVLAQSLENFLQRVNLIQLLDCIAVVDFLSETLPIYGGGCCIYDEECRIAGRITRRGSEVVLGSVSECTLSRDGIEYQVPIPPSE